MTCQDKREKQEALKNNQVLKTLDLDDKEIKDKVMKAMKIIQDNQNELQQISEGNDVDLITEDEALTSVAGQGLLENEDENFGEVLQRGEDPQQKFKKIVLTDSQLKKAIKIKTQEWAIEDNSDLRNFYDLLPKNQFAISYPFELDDFQKKSILHLEKSEPVLVLAHT